MKRQSAAVLVSAALATLLVAGANAQTTAAQPGSYNISMTNDCSGGGTRAVTGTYDATTGALSTTTTLTGCVVRNGDTFDGTTQTVGTLSATPTGFTIDITATVDTTITRADLSKVVRLCTTTKKGTFTTANQTFDGTTAHSNCSVTGKVLEHEGLIEHLLRPAIGEETGGGQNAMMRMLAPQPGEDSIREQHDMPGGMGGPGAMNGSGGMSGSDGMRGMR